MESVLKDLNPVLQMLTVMTLFSLLPFVFCCMTCFLRFTIVFSLLKTAMGVQVPPAIVTIGLCMILTFYTMGGVFQQMYERGSIPYQKNQNQGYANVLSHRAPLLSPPVYAPLVQNMMTNDVRRAILHLVITSAPRVRGPSREMELKNENRLLYLSPPLGGWSCPLLPAAGPEPHRL